MDGFTIVVGLIMVAGLIGIAVPVVPGLLVVWAAVLLWASEAHTTAGWVFLAIATTLTVSGFVLQYLLPGQRLRKAGVSTPTTLAAAALAFVGFFVIPVIGSFLGFALGIYLAERLKPARHGVAWVSTKHALKAIGLSMAIEMVTGLAVASTWLVGVAATS